MSPVQLSVDVFKVGVLQQMMEHSEMIYPTGVLHQRSLSIPHVLLLLHSTTAGLHRLQDNRPGNAAF